MNDIPRKELKRLIERFGISLSEDRLRCLGMLKDVCGEHKKEIAGIMAALDEGIPNEILKPDFSIDISRRLLSRRLEDNRGISEELAVWAVDTWAIALGVITDNQADNSEPVSSDAQESNSQVSEPEESDNTSTSTTAGVTTNPTLSRKTLQPPKALTPQPKRKASPWDNKKMDEFDKSTMDVISDAVLASIGGAVAVPFFAFITIIPYAYLGVTISLILNRTDFPHLETLVILSVTGAILFLYLQ